MKLNNKGFAITGFLYSIFAVFLVILSLLILSMTNSKITLEKMKKDIKKNLDEPDIVNGKYEQLFSYTGGVQTFTAPYSGWYQVELWGAKGAESVSNGAYVAGKIYLNVNEKIYVYVGQGNNTTADGTSFNGGTGSDGGTPGGGATDIRLMVGPWDNLGGLKSRIMVAAGSGSGSGNNSATLGAGGTLVGNAGGESQGGTQTTFGTSNYVESSFGIANGGCAGGNGYYPGGGVSCEQGAGGGSSFISGYAGVNAITSFTSLTPTNNTIHYSGKYFIDGYMESGINTGHGKAKITYISANKPERKNTSLNNVRYIKDCINANYVHNDNSWYEIQAIKDGINIAKNGSVATTGTYDKATYNLNDIIDGSIDNDKVFTPIENDLQCVTIDLGQSYDLDEIAVWHPWSEGVIYNDNVTSVSSNNLEWTEIINVREPETSNGKRINAYSN